MASTQVPAPVINAGAVVRIALKNQAAFIPGTEVKGEPRHRFTVTRDTYHTVPVLMCTCCCRVPQSSTVVTPCLARSMCLRSPRIGIWLQRLRAKHLTASTVAWCGPSMVTASLPPRGLASCSTSPVRDMCYDAPEREHLELTVSGISCSLCSLRVPQDGG